MAGGEEKGGERQERKGEQRRSGLRGKDVKDTGSDKQTRSYKS